MGGHLLPRPAQGFSTGLLRVQSLPGVSPAFDWVRFKCKMKILQWKMNVLQ